MSNFSNEELLNLFGLKLIYTSRDKTIKEAFNTLKGNIKDKYSLKLAKKLKDAPPKELEAIKEIIIDSVDGALNNFLWFLDENDIFDISCTKNNQTILLKETSDGLSVDYWNFVDEFSKYKRVDS